MSSSVEERIAHLEQSVHELEEAAARELVARTRARWGRIALFGVLIAIYAYYLNSVMGPLTGQ